MAVKEIYNLVTTVLNKEEQKELIGLFDDVPRKNTNPLTEEQLIKTHLKALLIHEANNICMTAKETAKFLGVHYNTVLSYIDLGKIKTSYNGKNSIPKGQFLDEIIKEFNHQ